MQRWIYVLIALLINSMFLVYGEEDSANIHGSFYNFYTFEKIDNVVLEINTTPKMKMVITTGNYSLNLTPGCYEFKVYTTKGEVIYISQEILCLKSGDMADYDFILLPEDKITSDLITTIEELEITYDSNNDNMFWWLGFFIIILIIPGFVFSYIYFHKKKTLEEYKDDENMKKLIEILKEKRRITQKELIKMIPLSESKISLMLAELEDKKIIKKIKKGRTNIIYWKGED